MSLVTETQSEVTGWQEKQESWSVLLKKILPWAQYVAQEVQSHQSSNIFLLGKLRAVDHLIARGNKIITSVVEPNGSGIPWEHGKDS